MFVYLLEQNLVMDCIFKTRLVLAECFLELIRVGAICWQLILDVIMFKAQRYAVHGIMYYKIDRLTTFE